jgi:hypothetical protein
VAVKRKILIFGWQGTNFVMRKEILVVDSPKLLVCVSNNIIVGYKKHYEVIDIASSTSTRLLDIDREHKLVSLEVC